MCRVPRQRYRTKSSACTAGAPCITISNSFVRWFGIGDTHAIHLIGGQGTEQTAPKATHFALTTDDLEGAMSRLTDAGVPFGDYAGQAGKVGVRGDGARSIYFQDPDHHWIEIVDAGTLR